MQVASGNRSIDKQRSADLAQLQFGSLNGTAKEATAITPLLPGVYGLRRALVIAGVESQVISLWKVDDEGTKDLMVGYYQRLRNNVGRSVALRQIQLQMLHTQQYQPPYYWAAFIASGDWTPMGSASPSVR